MGRRSQRAWLVTAVLSLVVGMGPAIANYSRVSPATNLTIPSLPPGVTTPSGLIGPANSGASSSTTATAAVSATTTSVRATTTQQASSADAPPFGSVTPIIPGPSAYGAVWSPDGRYIAYRNHGANIDINIWDSTNQAVKTIQTVPSRVKAGPSGTQAGTTIWLVWAKAANVLLIHTDVCGIRDEPASTFIWAPAMAAGVSVAPLDGALCAGTGPGNARRFEISADGQFIAYDGRSPRLPPPGASENPSATALYTWDRSTGSTFMCDSLEYRCLGLGANSWAPSGHTYLISQRSRTSDEVRNVIIDGGSGARTLLPSPPTGSVGGPSGHGPGGNPWSPTGRYILLAWFDQSTGENGRLRVFDTATKSLSEGQPFASDIRWMNDDSEPVLVFRSRIGLVKWTIKTNSLALVLPNSAFVQLTVSPTGRSALFRTSDQSISALDIVSETTFTTPIRFLAFGGRWSPDDMQFTYRSVEGAQGHGTAAVWSLKSNSYTLLPAENLYTTGTDTGMADASWSYGSRYLTVRLSNSCCGEDARGKAAYVWDIEAKRLSHELMPDSAGSVSGPEWSPTANILLLSSYASPETRTGSAYSIWTVGSAPVTTGNRVSLTATPSVRDVGDHVTLLATLTDSTGKPQPDTLLRFEVISGPNTGFFAAIVRTDATGTAATVLKGKSAGTDMVQAWLDNNPNNGVLDPGEARATTTVTWKVGVSVSPTEGVPGTSFTFSYSCPVSSSPGFTVVDGVGREVSQGMTVGLRFTDNGEDYRQTVIPTTGGNYSGRVTCNGVAAGSATFLVKATLPRSYVALGDSYSSGEGNPPFTPSSATNHCNRSPKAWPRLISELDSNVDMTKHIACSGATTDAVIMPFKGEDPQLSQLMNLSKKPDVITITIGGNDAGFAKVLRDCFVVDCVYDGTVATARRDIDRLERVLPSYYGAIRSIAPMAKVVVVGYPRLFPETQAESNRCGWLTEDERENMNNLVSKINGVIAVAAGQAGVKYAPVEESLDGHELCSAEPWINQVEVFPEDDALDSRAHPNALGQEAIAAAVLPKL